MGNHDQSLVLLPDNLLHQAQHLHGGLGIQVSRGLIGKYNLRIDHQGPGYSHTLLLSAGHLVGHMPGLSSHAYQVHVFPGFLKPLPPGNTPKGKGQGYILQSIHGV